MALFTGFLYEILYFHVYNYNDVTENCIFMERNQ